MHYQLISKFLKINSFQITNNIKRKRRLHKSVWEINILMAIHNQQCLSMTTILIHINTIMISKMIIIIQAIGLMMAIAQDTMAMTTTKIMTISLPTTNIITIATITLTTIMITIRANNNQILEWNIFTTVIKMMKIHWAW